MKNGGKLDIISFIMNSISESQNIQDNNEEDNEEIQSKNIEFNNNLTLENIDSLGYTDLKALAKEKSIKGYSTMKKDELISALS